MATSRVKTSSILQGFPKSRSLLAGNPYYIPPAFESIQTVTVGSGGSSTITFSSIPSTYTHLQIRGFAQTNRGTYGFDDLNMQFNGDTGSNYSWHYLGGQGSIAQTDVGVSVSSIEIGNRPSGTGVTETFGTSIIDILDYKNTNKNTVCRMLTGLDYNGTVAGFGGEAALGSGSWYNTSAITSILIYPKFGSSFNQYSQFALYGIKGA